jgi:hypothetical protein
MQRTFRAFVDITRKSAFLKKSGTGVAIGSKREDQTMKTHSEIVVTLTADLLQSLRAQSQELKIPLKWLIAGLVCDTIEPAEQPIAQGSRQPTRHVA